MQDNFENFNPPSDYSPDASTASHYNKNRSAFKVTPQTNLIITKGKTEKHDNTNQTNQSCFKLPSFMNIFSSCTNICESRHQANIRNAVQFQETGRLTT